MRSDYWQDVTRDEPCAICDTEDWCSVSTDGQWRICRRTDNGTGEERHGKTTYWLYRVDGTPVERPRAYDRPVLQAPTRADAATLHSVYTVLLSHLSLTKSHRDNLLARGLTPQEIAQRGYATLQIPGQVPYRTALARQLVTRFGADVCATVPGLTLRESDTDTARWSVLGAPGILIPVRDIDGRIVALKVRSDDPQPDANRYTYVSSAKHHGPSPGSPVHIPLHDPQHHQTVRITEGELKADIATCLSGILTISVPGVSSWSLALPVLAGLTPTPTRVLLAFDADWRDKQPVAGALKQAILGLQHTLYDLHIETWHPTHGKGIDDVLAAHQFIHLMPPARALGAVGRPTASPAPRTRPTRTLNAKEVSSWRRK